MDAIHRIEQALDSFPGTLSFYRQQLEHWASRTADSVSHAADMPSLMGMERVIRFGEHSTTVSSTDSEFFSGVVQCPQGGVTQIESKFESVYDIALGNIEVDVIAMDGGEATPVTLDAQGKGSFEGTPGKFYRVQVHSEVTPGQVEDLFKAYDGLTRKLDGWLRSEWQGFRPQWSHSVATAAGNGLLAGSWAAIEGVWDSIGLLSDILRDPGAFVERLGSGATELMELATTAPELMEKLQLLVSDEAALCLLLRTASLWLEMLPPSEIAGKTAEAASMMIVQLLIDVLIGVVLTFASGGAGIAYLSLRLADRAVQLLAAVKRLVKAIFGIVSTFIGYVDHYKRVAARGIAAGVKKGRMQLRWNARRNTTLKKDEPHDDSPDQAKNPNGDSADCVPLTCTNGCPVSMVTGEELLTLTDAVLDGVLPFEFRRLYRSSAVEIDIGLGFGWSHSLAHRLEFEGDFVVWVDHENRRTRFPLPSATRPAIHNSLSRAAVFLGDEPEELILALAGEAARFYHFRAGRLTAISDVYGNRLTLQRDRSDRIQRLDNGAGRSLLLRYDRAQLVGVDYQVFREGAWHTEQTLVSYRFDAYHNLIEATNAVGDSERYDYDDAHVILQRQLAGGASFFWEWERAGKAARCVRHWASFSQMNTRYVWADDGSVAVQYVDGTEETYVHDERARLVRKVEADGGEHLKAYDAAGRLIAEQDPLGAVTEYRYDEVGRLIALIPPDDAPTSYEYRNGFLCRRTRGDAVWIYRRNAEGDVTEAVDPDGQVTHYYYNVRGQLLSIRYPDSSRHKLVWNPLGQLTEETLPDGGVRRFSYDALGRRTTTADEHGAVTRQQWDAVGRLIQTTFPTGSSRAYSYGAYGQVTAERDELGRITRYEYDDELHLVSRRINPDGTQVQYRYDHAQLLLTEVENESGEKYRLDYTPSGLIRQETGFDGRRTAYAYDLNGHLLEKTEFGDDGSCLLTAYKRDAAGRLLIKTLPDGVKVFYQYDRLGRLIAVDDGQNHPLAFEYDRQDRLITEHQGWGTLRYAYDACGQLKRLRLPDNSKLGYYYAKGGALTAIDLNGTSLTRHVYQFGREVQRQQGLLLSEYAYDEQGRLLAHAVGHQRDSVYRRDYAYSANGNLAHIADSRHGQRTYGYDALDRLIRVRHSRDELPESFAHDPAGNLLMQDRAGPSQVKGNRLLMQGDRHYDYDAFGNLIRERRGKEQTLVTEYRYDSQHRLIGLTRPDGQTATYQYDAFGRRIRKTVDGQTTEFFWQGEQIVAESSENEYRSYVYEPGTFRPLALLDGKGPKKACPFYYQLDHLGTPQELTDYGGDIVWSAQYDAYGKVAALTLAGDDYLNQPLRFQGQYFDAESGLHYNRHRYYDPRLGRYLTPDPVKLAGGLNQYQYVPNPTGWVDPLGLSSNCPPPGKPGCEVPGGTGGARVEEGEPALPKLTAQERRARIDELAEENAKRRVSEYEDLYDMHTVKKHSSEIPDRALKQRAINGADPHTGVVPIPPRGNPSSQFHNWRMHLGALNKAMARDNNGLIMHTGEDQNETPIVRFELPGAGRGYKPNRSDPQNPILNENMNWFEVKFDKTNTQEPFTAPSEKK
ncbi:RHS repeat protein [Pseudomonas granadensis]|uniref:RHS repeat-associated core domain-containing protein n=1 Tax=Pseudomonas granadensis TaxID=1421430 RepID=UPI0019D24AFA|nr:RHS repeat-associated core domain-containing protein [Pseudomonas granadensis]MBN6773594.1 RHS repeat protein [Pseudomonas granadensis]MBN6804897.1 RHS repeat protein [Pseudomonas granadensis]MBN6832043.1 RHS repeat protein [Pseudomonas granadensis]MBN6838668.1 RHS repeat protein [Pseudomonas granadensis]MBN6867005.1 RHS repeat protein [Pseudomonas granadensis]